MKTFLHGVGGGVGRVFGRIVGLLLVALIGYLIINSLNLDIKKEILNKLLFLDVHAAEYDSDISSAIYTGTENCVSSQTGICALGEFTIGDAGSRVQFNEWRGGTGDGIYSIGFQVNTSIRANMATTLRLNGNQFGNHNYTCMSNYYSCQVVRISSSQLNINFNSGSTVRNNAYFFITIENGPVSWSGNNLIRFTSMRLIQNPYSDGGGGSGFDDSGIINNANQNTQDIINSNNENTQDIINSNNENTQDIIDNQNANSQKELENATCPVGPLILTYEEWGVENGYLNSSGVVTSNSGYKISPYMIIKPSTQYKLQLTNVSNNVYYCTYNASKTLIGCSALNSANITFTSSSYARYLRLSIGNSLATGVLGPVCNNWEKEAQDLATKKLDELGFSITDDNIDNGLGSNFFNNFDDEDFGLSDIITLPLTTIQSLTSTSCVTLDLPVPFTNESIHLPCMKNIYQQKVRGIYNLWVYASYGLVSYWIATDIFRMVKGFKDPEQDKVEVLDL